MSGIKHHGSYCSSCVNWEPHCKKDLGEGAASADYCARTSRGFKLLPLSIPSVSEQIKINASLNQKMKGQNAG